MMQNQEKIVGKTMLMIVFLPVIAAWQELVSLWEKVAIIPFYQ
ncbi:hypothetical protein [Methylophaga thiooxydans]|uniref:Uncharacterized protein n=1 Tax=Methylophaga thiooxydans DMS010 TaxID=637616 RepID=C0N1Q8_9GAMM|nr:hypothetical protein [Methylophaga thiooxydans]EEF81079.1 hypothetical protein MDMS009_71 [Methylophaga thiooxydans DMS010]